MGFSLLLLLLLSLVDLVSSDSEDGDAEDEDEFHCMLHGKPRSQARPRKCRTVWHSEACVLVFCLQWVHRLRLRLVSVFPDQRSISSEGLGLDAERL